MAKSNHLTPAKAIRLRCLDCSGFLSKEVRDCELHDLSKKYQERFKLRNGKKMSQCPLWDLRFRRRVSGTQPLKQIKEYCRDWCCLGQFNEVKYCPSTGCELFTFRHGHRHCEIAPLMPQESKIPRRHAIPCGTSHQLGTSTLGNEPNSITQEMLKLAKDECCNWFDGGDYCPEREIGNQPRTCLLKLGKQCCYFMSTVYPLLAHWRLRKRTKGRNLGDTIVNYE